MDKQELHTAIMQKIDKFSERQLQVVFDFICELESTPRKFLDEGDLEMLFAKYDSVFKQLAK